MWRNMVEQVGGRAVLGTPFVGLLAAQILAETATGTNGSGLLYNDGLTDGKRYSLRLQSALGTDGIVYENGSWTATAPATSSYLLYEDNILVPGGAIAITVGTPAGVVPSNTGAPSITGSAVQGSTLTASNGTWANTPTSYVYRWVRGSTSISGATASTYVLQAGDVGSQLRVGVTAINATGSSIEALSAQTSVVTSTGDGVPPSLTGSITVGTVTSSSIQFTWPLASDLVGVTGYETSLDGISWVNRGSVLTYTHTSLGASTSYTFRVRAKDAAGNVSAVLSVTQMTGSASAAPTNTGVPVITGSTMQGQVLSGSNGSWTNSPSTYAYRWIRGGVTIAGASSAAYLLVSADVGTQIQFGVIATNAFGSSTESISVATTTVSLPAIDEAAPTLLGTIGVSFLNEGGYTATCPVATDVYGVVGYQYRIDAGSWVDILSGRVITITGRTSGVTDTLEMRAYDAALNYSSPLSRSVTPSAIGSYVFPGGVAAVNMKVPKTYIALLGEFAKQVDEVIDYDIDFSDWFVGRLDNIGSIDVITDAGILVLGSAFSDNTVRVVLGGGVSGICYKITVQVTTDADLPIVREADFYVEVENV